MPIVISLVSVPVYLRHIGLERYGVLSLCWLLLGYLGLFDFGLGRAIGQRIAVMRDDDPGERSAVFWTGLFASVALSLVAALIALPVFTFALGYMKFSSPQVNVLSMTVFVAACIRFVPLHRPRLAPAGTLRSLLAYGGWISVTNVVGPILQFVDRFVVGSLISAASVSVYSIPFNLVTRLTLLPDAMSRALFPRYAVSKGEEAAVLCRDGVAAISVLVSPAAIIMVGAVEPFLRLWIGAALAVPASQVAWCLVIGFWFNCFALVAYTMLQAQGRPDIPAKLHVAYIIPFVPVL